MLQELVKNKARDIYAGAGKNVMDAAIAECSKLGLSHTAAKELLTYVLSDDPKVPSVAESHLMAQIVNGIELAVNAGVVVDGVNGDTGAVSWTADALKGAKISELREIAANLKVDIVGQDKNKLTREQITAGILAKQAEQ